MASISYIITTYNRPHSMLFRAMQSIVLELLEIQSELIVVDDCSIEPAIVAPSIVAAFGGKVQVIRNVQNEGISRSRTTGLMAAQYEYVLFLDDDDVAYPNRSLNLLSNIEGTSCAFVAGRTRLLVNTSQCRVIPIQHDLPLTPLRYLSNMAHINGVIWRRKALLKMGGFDNRVPYFGEQITMLLLILRGHSALQIGTIVSQFQHIPGGLTQLSKHHNLMKQYLLAMLSILMNETLGAGFRQVCEEVILFLRDQTSISLDGFLNHINQRYQSPVASFHA